MFNGRRHAIDGFVEQLVGHIGNARVELNETRFHGTGPLGLINSGTWDGFDVKPTKLVHPRDKLVGVEKDVGYKMASRP